MTKRRSPLTLLLVFSAALLLLPPAASAQQGGATQTAGGQQPNVPGEVRQAEEAVERTVERFRIGVEGGVGLDPELIMFGAHGAFAPIFHRNVEFRPGIEFGVGELTTLFGINLEALYLLPGATRATRWMPYIGVGPNFSLSHRDFDPEDDEDDSRFDFSDTDFESGLNFIAGARAQNGLFLEMKATAYGVSNIRLLAGFNF